MREKTVIAKANSSIGKAFGSKWPETPRQCYGCVIFHYGTYAELASTIRPNDCLIGSVDQNARLAQRINHAFGFLQLPRLYYWLADQRARRIAIAAFFQRDVIDRCRPQATAHRAKQPLHIAGISSRIDQVIRVGRICHDWRLLFDRYVYLAKRLPGERGLDGISAGPPERRYLHTFEVPCTKFPRRFAYGIVEIFAATPIGIDLQHRAGHRLECHWLRCFSEP